MVWLKRLWSSLVLRITILTIVALKLMFAGVLVIFQTVSLTGAPYPPVLSDNAKSIAELVWLVDQVPDEIQPFVLSTYESAFRVATIRSGFAEGLRPRPEFQTILSSSNRSDVASDLEAREIRFQALGLFTLPARLGREGAEPLRALSALHVAIELEDGRVLNIWLSPALSLEGQITVFGVVGIFLALLSVALGFSIAAVTQRPIRRLEQYAARVELRDSPSAVSRTDPAEMQRVSAALNHMRERLGALIRERERMVAAIAHDVRTGLTRIRLRMDETGAVSAEEIESDVAQMEALISDMIAYARAESPPGNHELIRLDSFIATLVASAPFPIEFSRPEGGEFVIAGDPVALRRLFENLIENARRYGGGAIAVRVIAEGGGREIRIEDEGPGLPDDQLEQLFQPFQRGEASRNRSTGGSGLGLGIARAIARAHGATVTLANRPQGGLAAIVRFPPELRT